MLHLKCKGQEMKVDVDERIADKYINANKVHFEFCERWAGMIITAQFTQKQKDAETGELEDKTYDVVVDELTNMVTMPNEIVAGEVHISAFGVDPVTGVRITSIPVKKTIDKSGFVGDGETPVPPTPDLYAQLLEQFGNGVPPSTGAYKQLVTDKSGAIVWDNLRVMAGTNHGSVRTSAAAAEQTLGYKLGNAAFAANMETEASGQAAFAAGFGTEAIGKNSFAEGQHTVANGENQHVQGKYNIKDTENKYAHIVGNGTTSAKRANAHTLDWDGNAWFKGSVYVGGDDQSKGEKLVTKSELDAAVAAGGGGSGEGGGGGLPTGGDPNMMLVTDADGNAKWDERTHWVERENVVCLEETELMGDGEGMFVLLEPMQSTPTVGGQYTVTYNGVPYECAGVSADSIMPGAVGLGNVSTLSGNESDYTDDPFGLIVIPVDQIAEMGVSAMFIPTDSPAEVTLSISGTSEIVHTLDEKFVSVPNSNIKNGKFTGYSTATLRGVKTCEEDDEYTMGDCAVAFGNGTKASGEYSTAFGMDTTASGMYSCAFGYETEAKGDCSFAVGNHIVATKEQIAFGHYNVEDTANAYLLVGGQGSPATPRNVYTLSTKGDAWHAGTVEGTALILKSSTSGSTKRFKITVDDSGTITATAL